MLTGSLKEFKQYIKLLNGDVWHKSFAALASLDPDSQLGITELFGDSMYINVHTYKTRDEKFCNWESHSRMIDLQYIITGSEFVGYAPTELLGNQINFNPDKDRFDYTSQPAKSKLYLSAGHWAIFFPEDGHKPMIATNEHDSVLKAVVKINSSLLNVGMK